MAPVTPQRRQEIEAMLPDLRLVLQYPSPAAAAILKKDRSAETGRLIDDAMSCVHSGGTPDQCLADLLEGLKEPAGTDATTGLQEPFSDMETRPQPEHDATLRHVDDFRISTDDGAIAFSPGISAVEGRRRNEFSIDFVDVLYHSDFKRSGSHQPLRRTTITTRLGHSKSPDGDMREWRVSELASVALTQPNAEARFDLMLGVTGYVEATDDTRASAGGDLDFGLKFFVVRPEPNVTSLFLTAEAAGAIGLRGDITGGDHSDGFRSRWRATASGGVYF